MMKILILDFKTADVYAVDYDNNLHEDFDDFLKDFNEKYDLSIKETDCQWMIMDQLNIKIL